MKYIMFEVSICGMGIKFLPFIFPDVVVHRQMFHAVKPHLLSLYETVKLISAGEYDPATGVCYGKSESLNVESRPIQDNDIIASYNTLHGKL